MQTVDTIDTWDKPIGTGALLLAPDDKIYFARAYESQSAFFYIPYADSMRNYINENLSVINEPDSLGVKCDYQPFSFYLGGKRTYYGLPNNPNYELGRYCWFTMRYVECRPHPSPSPVGEEPSPNIHIGLGKVVC
ncbi:MAG: hypothetical protein IPP29_16155 [Bacteroidetes bacterium]|nr:hypothetical protein [Bacteroidota bacterium]